MKNCMICITLLLCISAGSSAQFIYNPANTPGVGNGNAWPFNLHTGWRFQFIIDKKVLGGGPLLISDIAFSGYYSPAKTFSVPDFQMRMGHTTYSNFGSSSANPLFDNVLGPTPTEVYTRGAIKWVCNYQAWSDIGLTNSFAYNGNDNICVEIRYNTTTSGGVTIITDPGISRAYTHTIFE